MKPTELRIGNLIQYNEGDVCKVIGIHEFGIDVEFPEEFTYMEYDQFSPIPLTEEWLLKFGFEKIGGSIYKDIGSIEIGVTGNKRFYIQIRVENVTLEIKTVHQLQNLYYALAGDELIITEL